MGPSQHKLHPFGLIVSALRLTEGEAPLAEVEFDGRAGDVAPPGVAQLQHDVHGRHGRHFPRARHRHLEICNRIDWD